MNIVGFVVAEGETVIDPVAGAGLCSNGHTPAVQKAPAPSPEDQKETIVNNCP